MKTFTNFSFHMFTDILFGKATEKQVAQMVKKHGGTKVMLVYGGGSIKKIGLYDTVTKALDEAGIPFIELGGVQPNPRRSLADKGLEMAQKEGIDFLLAIGGGSAIDTAKAIALGLANGGNYWQFYQGAVPEKIAKVGTIHTIAAAGSETSGSTVILDDLDTHHKFGIMYSVCRPVFAIMNPELTYSVSPYQTAVGTADIFAHTFDRYFMEPSSHLGDEYCEGTLRTTIKYGPIAIQKPQDYEARAELMLAGSFSHNDLTSIGRFTLLKGSAHGLEANISALYDTAHGAGLAVLMPAYLQYLVNAGTPMHLNRVAQFAVKVFGVEADMNDPKAVAEEGILRLRAWLKSLGAPITFKELGILKEGLLAELVAHCRCDAQGILPGYLNLDKKAVESIFQSVME